MELGCKGATMVDRIYREIGDQISLLLMDQYGNYLFQKLIALSTDEQKRDVIQKIKDKLATASKSDQGTRCVQTLISNCKQADMLEMIIDGLSECTLELCSDANDVKPERLRQPLFKQILKNAIDIAKAKYGCSVIIKCTNIMDGYNREQLLRVIEIHTVELIQNHHSNYIIQNLINNSPVEESQRFCRHVLGHVIELSMQKCSSNVVESSIQNGDDATRDSIIDELLAYGSMIDLLNDHYANYVIQKALVRTIGKKKKELAMAIMPFVESLSESRSGQCIIPKIMGVLDPKTLSEQ